MGKTKKALKHKDLLVLAKSSGLMDTDNPASKRITVSDHLSPGEDGMFSDFHGTFQKLTDEEKVKVLSIPGFDSATALYGPLDGEPTTATEAVLDDEDRRAAETIASTLYKADPPPDIKPTDLLVRTFSTINRMHSVEMYPDGDSEVWSGPGIATRNVALVSRGGHPITVYAFIDSIGENRADVQVIHVTGALVAADAKDSPKWMADRIAGAISADCAELLGCGRGYVMTSLRKGLTDLRARGIVPVLVYDRDEFCEPLDHTTDRRTFRFAICWHYDSALDNDDNYCDLCGGDDSECECDA